MDAVGAARLFVDYRRLRLTGSRAAARRLVNAVGSRDEDLRTLAGMFLVRAGRRSLPELEHAIAERHPQLPTLLLILADIGDGDAKGTLEGFAGDPDPDVARAAADGLSTIAMREKLERGESPFKVDASA